MHCLQNDSLFLQQARLAQTVEDKCGILFILLFAHFFPSFLQNYCEQDIAVKSTVIGVKQTWEQVVHARMLQSCRCHILVIHPSTEGHLGGFYLESWG